MDAPDYMTSHSYCEDGHFMTLAWYEGFANWVRHVAFGRHDWQTNQLTLTPSTGPCPTPGFNLEGNVTALLDALYFGPVINSQRPGLTPGQFTCPAGLNRNQGPTGLVLCNRVTAAVCPPGLSLNQNGLCASPGFRAVSEELYARLLRACRSRPEREAGPCPDERVEPGQAASCPPGATRQNAVCLQRARAASAFPGATPLPGPDGTPDTILAPAQGGGQRWFSLASFDTLLGFVVDAGPRAHRMEEFWNGWIKPWCLVNDPDGTVKFCNPAQSPGFVTLFRQTTLSNP